MEYLAVFVGSGLFFLVMWKLLGLVDDQIAEWRRSRG